MEKQTEELLKKKNAQLVKQLAAKNRELQIEAVLEEVRASSLAMHRSDEIKTVVSVIYEKIKELNIVMDGGVSLVTFTPGSKDLLHWYANPNIEENSLCLHLPYFDNLIVNDCINAKEKGMDMLVKIYSFEEKNEYFSYAFEHSDFRLAAPETKQWILEQPYFGFSFPMQKHSGIFFNDYTGKLFSDEENEIFKRFSKVFEQAYVRFLDLQKAEEQAKEGQIQLALERVRARTMAMQRSDELAETVFILFQQFKELGEVPDQATIGIINEAGWVIEYWVTMYGNQTNKVFKFSIDEPNVTRKIYNGWKAREKSLVIELSGKKLHEFSIYRAAMGGAGYNETEKLRVINVAFFSKGIINVQSHASRSPESIRLLERFARVFEQTYTRFLDLKQAESQAREAKIEAGLERVRSRTLAMQNSDELAETAAVVFKQLIGLGIEPNRLFIGIIKDDSGDIELWATDEDGSKVSTRFTGNKDGNISVKKMYMGWKERKSSITIDMEGKELRDYFHYLKDKLHVPFKLGLSQKRRIQNIAYFSQGFIGMASPDMQPAATNSLLERFAGVFNLTFARFHDLQIAEAHAIQAEQDLILLQTEKKRAEDALTELKAAQTKLIQTEKMASLGELTAGIAHEIQNPLNFVNNFSEVSVELLQELKEEAEAGHTEDVITIANDLTQNLEKINHHGKRADLIVKGMLEHSRVGTGEKQLTDINVLADEFLRLSYHGLRAKDKSFNAEMITYFDGHLPKVNIAQQDIGRVLLNLFNNAFYTVNQKQKIAGGDYMPEVTVKTSAEKNNLIITVKDNGNGIPDNIKDKIMQPFFTTKPTGEGTGLGLSLSYDIVVKGHGGKLDFTTAENEGTAFIISLPTES